MTYKNFFTLVRSITLVTSSTLIAAGFLTAFVLVTETSAQTSAQGKSAEAASSEGAGASDTSDSIGSAGLRGGRIFPGREAVRKPFGRLCPWALLRREPRCLFGLGEKGKTPMVPPLGSGDVGFRVFRRCKRQLKQL